MKKWQLQEAKNRLSEVVRKASEEGPQVVTLRGDDAVVVIDASAYRRLASRSREGLAEFIRRSPLARGAVDIDRWRDATRRAFA
jgi:prevent-host-death family protein